MKEPLTMGSLFDGSGGFPLICQRLGIEPVWAAEVEPFPIKVTRKRFPQMKHLGDISAINGRKIKKTNIVTGGSPCQSLSLAGKRDGLSKKCVLCGYLVSAVAESDICPVCGGIMAYTRSGLFMEQIRVIKEMREDDISSGRTDKSVRPRFMLWENVPGALSSPGGANAGEDFRVVLEETIRVKDPTATVPRPKGGSGSKLDVSWEMGILSHGECLMHNIGVSPKDEIESHLWQILEDRPHQKYFLSEKACQGIYRRANSRGKKLPETLLRALIRQGNIQLTSEEPQTESK